MKKTTNTAFFDGPRLAVLIGIDAYQNGIQQLRNAKNDIDAVGTILHRDHGYSLIRLVDGDATLSRLKVFFAKLAEQVTKEYRLIIYFAGHGIALEMEEDQDGPQGFLLPQDARRDDVASYLSMKELQEWLAKFSKCSHLLLFLDCCFAGAFRWSTTRSLASRPMRLYRERFDRYVRESAWQVITSAAHDERALDTVAGGRLGRRDESAANSPFAAALCEGLQGAADLRVGNRPGDGVIVASELHLYLESRFAQMEGQQVAQPDARPMQRPMLWSLDGRDKGQFIFVVPGRSALMLESALELNERNNPYRGLLPYDQEHSALFFGRQAVTAELHAQVCAQPLTVVLGVSGSGKSSLVRAGLVPRIKTEPGWRILSVLRPGAKPLAALSSISTELGCPEQDFPSALATVCQRDAGQRFLLVIDQLEELITTEPPAEEQEGFFAQIARAQQHAKDQLRIVMTLRADFEPHFASLRSTRESEQVRFLLRPLNRDELREVIEGPAVDRVLYFEPPGLVNRLIDEVAEMPGALPLLSFALSEMYRSFLRRSADDRTLRTEDVAAGGVSGALRQRADEIHESLDDLDRLALRYLMLRMVALEGGERSRRRVMRLELRYEEMHTARVERVLDLMLAARLLVSGTDADGEPYVEPAHDTLILGWPTLATFIKEENETLPLQHRLTQAAKDWAANQRDPRRLWVRDPRLPQILALLAERPERFNEEERRFIKESEARRRRQRIFTASLVAAIVTVLSGITVYALITRQRAVKAQHAESEQRVRAQKQEQAAQDARGTAELAQYRAQIRAAQASVAADQRPAAHRMLLSTNPRFRNWEWAYLLARTGPRPTQLDDLSESGELLKVLETFPAARADSGKEERDEESEGVQQDQKRPGVPLATADNGGRRGGTLTVEASNKTKLLTVQTGLYGAITSPHVADDASVVVVSIECGETHHSTCETGAGDILTDGIYVLDIPPPPPAGSPKKPAKLISTPEQRAFFNALKMDPESDPSQLPFEAWIPCNGQKCALVMEGTGAKAIWLVSPPQRLRTLSLPAEARNQKPAGEEDGESAPFYETQEDAIAFDHGGCATSNGKLIFGFPIGPKRRAVLFASETGSPLVTMKAPSGEPAKDIGSDLETHGEGACYFSPDEKAVVRTSVARNYMFLQIWDTATGEWLYPTPELSQAVTKKERGLPYVPLGIAWDQSGSLFATYEKDRSLNLYRRPGGRQIASFKNQRMDADFMENPSFRMLLSPDKKRLLLGSFVVDVEDSALLLELPGETQSAWKSFISQGKHRLAFWEAYQGHPGVKLTLRDQLLLWQVRQADKQSAQQRTKAEAEDQVPKWLRP